MQPAVDTSGFREPQIGVLFPKVLHHLVWTTVSPTMTLGTAGNRTQVKSWILEVNALLVADPVSIPLERLGACGVIARNYCCKLDWSRGQ